MNTQKEAVLPEDAKGLPALLRRAADLLRGCDRNDLAGWFAEAAAELSRPSCVATARQDLLAEIRRNLAGMGSFSDIALAPAKDSRLSADEARKTQWRLTEEIGRAVDHLLDATEPGP